MGRLWLVGSVVAYRTEGRVLGKDPEPQIASDVVPSGGKVLTTHTLLVKAD